MKSVTMRWENYLKQTSSFLRFLLVGIINTLAALTIIFFLMNISGQSYYIATFIGNCVGAGISYGLNHHFTFKSRGRHRQCLWRFLFVILACYFLAYPLGRSITASMANIVLLPFKGENIAVFLGAALYTVMNYAGQKLFVFPSS